MMSAISEEVRSRLERQYHPNQSSDFQTVAHLHPQQTHEFSDAPQDSATTSDAFQGECHHETVGRGLPKCPISDENLAEQYAAFILYCNPTIPLDTDTKELKEIFRAPPRSDGKAFSTWTLFQLIKKLETKEIKTWAQLALDLGVEPPALDKGQSAQKVQQYAVRLKRWMHAMHVDAFFEFLMSKPHPYWTHIPAASQPLPDNGRDGVPTEEDLAIRALLPETRPKRGRRKNEDREGSELAKSPAQRARLHSPTLSDDFLVARASLIPHDTNGHVAPNGFNQSFEDSAVPWSAMEARDQLGAFRWPPTDHTSTPLTAHPQSAITPTTRNNMWNDEPQSAITPKSRSRRRHGPAVSSAWPSAGSSSGKLRGRPPANRSVQDGPYSTFPANPTLTGVPANPDRDNSPASTQPAANIPTQQSLLLPIKSTPSLSNGMPRGPGRLSLQVPQREGGSVRLATPPPAPPLLLVTSVEDSSSSGHENSSSRNMAVPRSDATGPLPANAQTTQTYESELQAMASLEAFFSRRILAAQFITHNGKSLTPCTPLEASRISKAMVTTLQTDKEHHDVFLIFMLSLAALATQPPTDSLKIVRTEVGDLSSFEGRWHLGRQKVVSGSFVVKASVTRESMPREQEDDVQNVYDIDGTSWKEKYFQLKEKMEEKDAKVEKLKQELSNVISQL